MIAANSGNDVKIAELVQNDLTAAGIEVEVVAYDSAVRDEMVNAGDYEFALVGNGGWGGKAPAYLRTIFSDLSKNRGGNPHSMGPIGYSSERITEMCIRDRERNAILRHMFPLTPVPPCCRIGWLVCLTDKWCSLREIFCPAASSALIRRRLP